MTRDTKDLLTAATTLKDHFKMVEKRMKNEGSAHTLVAGVAANFSHEIMEVCLETLRNQIKLEQEVAALKEQMAELVKPTHIAKPKGLTQNK